MARARPLFAGHRQPHLPAHLGFYDLRVTEARSAQAALARAHDIEGFCYWHYWFRGRRLLNQPFDEVLSTGAPHFPFCLAWANETWSRRWLGEERDILIKQEYSPDDDERHARWALPALADPRAVRVEGRPLFLVYRPGDLPAPKRTTDVFREVCTRSGLPEPFLVGVNSNRQVDTRTIGFDANLEFEPQLRVIDNALDDGLKVHDYAEVRRRMQVVRPYPTYKSIFVSWDNTPRRGENGIVFINSSPQVFEDGLRERIDEVADHPFEQRLVFINAWNEWAEGNHLEPDQFHGLGYLEAVRRADRVDVGARHAAGRGIR